MNIELKFKPGVRTSLNSDNNIRKNFAAKSTSEGAVQTVRNSTGSSAAANLQKMSLSTGDWSSKNGSVLNAKNSGSASAATSKSSYSRVNTAPRKGTKQDANYVSSGFRNKQADAKDLRQRMYTGSTDYSSYWSRGAYTGYSGRAFQRIEDNYYAYLNANMPKPVVQEKSGWQKFTDGLTAVTTVAGLVTKGIDAWDSISSKSSNSTSSTQVSSAGGASADVVDNMKSAQNSSELSTAITLANQQAGERYRDGLDYRPKDRQLRGSFRYFGR